MALVSLAGMTAFCSDRLWGSLAHLAPALGAGPHAMTSGAGLAATGSLALLGTGPVLLALAMTSPAATLPSYPFQTLRVGPTDACAC